MRGAGVGEQGLTGGVSRRLCADMQLCAGRQAAQRPARATAGCPANRPDANLEAKLCSPAPHRALRSGVKPQVAGHGARHGHHVVLHAYGGNG